MQKLTIEEVSKILELARAEHAAHSYLRMGQCFFNFLYDLHPDIANSIRGTEYDPFYDSKKLQECALFITEY
ncbi:MAG: hypothetical protein WA061_01990 [Microgenomates group bacterium]